MTRDELWDRFIDAIDQAGQAGVAADVLVPAEVDATLAGKRFGDLTPIDIEGLARLASQVGRREETIRTLYSDMRRRAKGAHKLQRRRPSK